MFSRDFLKSLKVEDKELPKEIVESIMAEYGKAVKDKDEKIETLTTEKDGLNTQLTGLNEKVKGLSNEDNDKLKEQIKDLNDKYNADTQELKEKIAKQEYGYKIKELTNDLHFSSESAKKSFIRDLEDNKLEIKDGKLEGFDDFVSNYKTNDPRAFIEEKEPEKVKSISLGGENGSNPKPILSVQDELKEKLFGKK